MNDDWRYFWLCAANFVIPKESDDCKWREEEHTTQNAKPDKCPNCGSDKLFLISRNIHWS